MLFVCYPKCTTCQKAQRWLEERGVPFEVRDIKAHNPSLEELRAWIGLSGLPIRRFFNTSGQKYRELSLAEKLPGMEEEAQLALLASDGMLVRRPLLVDSGFVLAGFRPGEWEERLG